jgi:hypothetical protein
MPDPSGERQAAVDRYLAACRAADRTGNRDVAALVEVRDAAWDFTTILSDDEDALQEQLAAANATIGRMLDAERANAARMRLFRQRVEGRSGDAQHAMRYAWSWDPGFGVGVTCSCLWRGGIHDNQRDAEREHAEHAEHQLTGLSAGGWAMAERANADRWGRDDFAALPHHCFIAACDSTDIDERGPVFLRDGTIRKACTEHWEGVFRVLGEQASWERMDGAREDDHG